MRNFMEDIAPILALKNIQLGLGYLIVSIPDLCTLTYFNHLFQAAVLWLCFKLPFYLFGHTRDTSDIHEKAKCVCFICIYVTTKSEIHICSNKHETGLVLH